MKNIKIPIIAALACIVAIIFVGNLYFDQRDIDLIETEQPKVTADNAPIIANETVQQSSVKPSSAASKANEQIEVSRSQTQAKSRITWSRKHFDDQWCNAQKELSKSDYQFAQTQQLDWDVVLGKAKVSGHDPSYFNEKLSPNNQYIEAYESLPIEQLHALALDGDKWAMVAFVQSKRVNNAVKDKIAKKLLVQGASYYALEQLVRSALVAAQGNIQSNQEQAAIGHIIDALTYAYWGLEHYNDAGLGSFMAITRGEPFITTLPIEPVLKNSQEEINQRLLALKNWVALQRADANIEIPEPPAAVKKLFPSHIAMRESISKEQLDLYRSLDISANERIASTPCIEKINAYYKQELENY